MTKDPSKIKFKEAIGKEFYGKEWNLVFVSLALLLEDWLNSVHDDADNVDSSVFKVGWQIEERRRGDQIVLAELQEEDFELARLQLANDFAAVEVVVILQLGLAAVVPSDANVIHG